MLLQSSTITNYQLNPFSDVGDIKTTNERKNIRDLLNTFPNYEFSAKKV